MNQNSSYNIYNYKKIPLYKVLSQYLKSNTKYRSAAEEKVDSKGKRYIIIFIQMQGSDENYYPGYHITIYEESWDGIVFVYGNRPVGPYSLHVTDQKTKARTFYEAEEVLSSIQNSSLSTINVPWFPYNDLENILKLVLGLECRLKEVKP